MDKYPDGFYWIEITTDTLPLPIVAERMNARWFVPGNEVELNENEVVVLSDRLQPPKEVSDGE